MVPYIFSFLWNIITNFYMFSIYDDICYKLFKNRLPLTKEQEHNIEGEVVVVTGANRGIGKQIAFEMAKRKATVVFGCRNMKDGEKAVEDVRKRTGNNNLDLVHLDLMDMNSVEEFAKTVSNNYPRIKLLVNNAGVSPKASDNPNELTKDGFNPIMAANHLGHFLLTNMLLENLREGSVNGHSRIIVVSSTVQTVSELDTNDLMMKKSGYGYFNINPYSNSKHANSLMARELAKRLKDECSNVYVYSICPLIVETDIYDDINGYSKRFFDVHTKIFGLTVSEAVTEHMVPICLSKDIGENESGLMFRHRKPWGQINCKLSKEDQLSENLWNLSARLVKLNERLPHPSEIITPIMNDNNSCLNRKASAFSCNK